MCWEPVHPNRITQVGGGLFFWHFILLNRSRVPQAQMYEEAWTAYSKQKFSEVWTVWTVWIGRVSQKNSKHKTFITESSLAMLQSKSNCYLRRQGKDSSDILNRMDLYQHSIWISTQLSSNINSRRASINLLISFQATNLASQLLEERPEDVAAQRLFKFGKPSGCDFGFWWDVF